MSGPEWTAATDRAMAELGVSAAELARRLGYASDKALHNSRAAGVRPMAVAALRAVAVGAPALMEED